MRRAIVPLAIVLALVTGAVLAETRQVLTSPAVARADPRPAAAASLVRQSYGMANEYLATGDEAGIADILDSDFVDHDPRPGTTPDRAGFVDGLRSLRAIAPAARLAVLDLVAERDRVAVRVAVEGVDGAAFLGLPIPPDRLWADGEVFRVEADRIVERWGDSMAPALFSPLLTVNALIEEPVGKVVTLERWTYAPGSAETIEPVLGISVLVVDTGELTVRTDPGSGRATGESASWVATGGGPVRLSQGNLISVPQGDRITLRNEGNEPVTVLVLAAIAPMPTESAETAIAPPAGIRHEVLAGGPIVDVPPGMATIAIGRAAFAAGAAFPAHQVSIAELVAVETGTMALTDSGGAWVSTVPNAGPRPPGDEPIAAGGGVRVDRGAVAGYAAAGDTPLGIVLVSIRAAADQ